MLDLEFIRNNPDLVKKNNQSRGIDVDVGLIIKLDSERRDAQNKFDTLRAEQKKLSKGKPSTEDAKKLKDHKAKVKDAEKEMTEIDSKLKALQILLPNMNHSSTPVGGEEDCEKISEVGDKPKFDFDAKDHVALDLNHEMFDLARGAKVSGNRFWYLKGKAVEMQWALTRYTLDILIKHNFIPMVVPNMVRREALHGTGFLPAQEFEIYRVNPDDDDLYLIGTSEAPLIAYHGNETIDVSKPIRYCALTPCYRREAGAYGKDTKGIFRGHQFDKIEMVSFVSKDDSDSEHDALLAIEEEILGGLGLPYRVVNLASQDLSIQAAKCYDIEGWFPGQDAYRELTSCSNTTDFQSRRLNIRYKTSDGLQFVHTLNGTACAMGRTIIAILENYQKKDGSVEIPKPLRKYCSLKKIG